MRVEFDGLEIEITDNFNTENAHTDIMDTLRSLPVDELISTLGNNRFTAGFQFYGEEFYK